MTEPSAHYTLGRLDVLVERSPLGDDWLVIVNREASPQFVSAMAIAHCTSPAMAQELARLVIGIEVTRDGASIWPTPTCAAECDCADRSWYGAEHDSACPLQGERARRAWERGAGSERKRLHPESEPRPRPRPSLVRSEPSRSEPTQGSGP